MNRNRKGFTLIELMIVVAIIGIIVAIAIPNLLNAIQRAKQRRTMGDIRSIATAMEAYSVDLNRYPPAAGTTYGTITFTEGTTVGATLKGYISPTYIRVLPDRDGWNSYINVQVTDNYSTYILGSAGRDGAWADGGGGPTTNFNADIIFTNGQFAQYPEGIQQDK